MTIRFVAVCNKQNFISLFLFCGHSSETETETVIETRLSLVKNDDRTPKAYIDWRQSAAVILWLYVSLDGYFPNTCELAYHNTLVGKRKS